MKADFSRSTFDPAKHIRDVRWQMGRVPLDADLNEYVDIAAHRVETETVDVVGKCGGPKYAAGFQLATAATSLPEAQQEAAKALGALAVGDFLVSAGRYYVHGVLVENGAPMTFSGQSAGDHPAAKPIDTAGVYLAYLDVWARHLTYLDDPSLREVALGGPDTATRNRNVWQLKLVHVGEVGTWPDCGAAFEAFSAATAASTGRLAAEVDPTAPGVPCVIPPGGGYRRLENQLYRVEVHDAGSADGAATFKWSRDNGAIVSGWQATSTSNTIRLKQPPRDAVTAFATGQWVELTDDTRDLDGTPGELLEVADVDGDLLVLASNVTASAFPRNPKVRRWESVSKVGVTSGAWIALEDGVRIQFAAGTYRTGDYWLIPARTATGDVEWPRPGGSAAFLAPRGIEHRYCRVGFVAFTPATTSAVASIETRDCRKLFPPLTALDRCDLRLHNRDLHGKGVVCGLQVVCGGDEPHQNVVIRPGHAIDCTGADLLLSTATTFAVATRARERNLLDASGTGMVQVTLRSDDDGRPAFDLEAAPAEPTGLANIVKHLLEGTVWMDFYRDCLKPLADFLRAQLGDRDPGDTLLVTVQQHRLMTAQNLFAHASAATPSHRLWLSPAQHALLAELYGGLVRLAAGSEAFCAIDTTFPDFPANPFEKRRIHTGFIARRVDGLAVSPTDAAVVLWGASAPTHVFVFGLRDGQLMLDVAVDGADGLTVKDVAFAEHERSSVAVVLAGNGSRSVLTMLDAQSFKPVGSPVLFADNGLVRIVAHPRRKDTILAVEPGVGVHTIDLDTVSSGRLQARWQFAAAGHLEVGADRAVATAVLASGTSALPAGTYNAVAFGTLHTTEDSFDNRPQPLIDSRQRTRVGEDGLAIGIHAGATSLHVVVNPLAGETQKTALVFRRGNMATAEVRLPLADDGSGATGPVALCPSSDGSTVVYALQNRNQLVWASADGSSGGSESSLPAQAGPVAVARTSTNTRVLLIANQGSETVTLIDEEEIRASAVTDAQLETYRDALMAAFQRLALAVLQHLKDCLCQNLLVDCPRCAENETLPLARVEIREGRVFHVCSFDRLDVLTFPKVKYWLSVVPILPFVGYLVERFCCWVFAGPKRDGATAGVRTTAGTVSPEVVAGAVQILKKGNFASALSSNALRARTVSTHLVEDFGRRAAGNVATPESSHARIDEVLGQDVGGATTLLERKGVNVASIETYDAALGSERTSVSTGAVPTKLKAGEAVRLFTRGGKVAFYQVVPAAGGGDTSAPTVDTSARADVTMVRAQLDALRASHAAELAARDVEMERLKQASESVARDFATRDKQLSELDARNQELVREVSALAARGAGTTSPVDLPRLKEAVTVLQNELVEAERKRKEELANRDRQLAEFRSTNEQLAREMATAHRRFDAEIQRLSGRRPPG